MKKLVVRAAIFAIFTAGLTTTVGIAGAGTAMACEATPLSDRFAATLPQVNYGDTGPIVVGMQIALHNNGYTYLNGTGVYSDNTLQAVQDFQRRNGINPSGIVGSKTWQALVGRMPASHTMNGERTPPSFGIQPGEVNEDKMSTLFEVAQRIYPYYETGLPDEYRTYNGEWQALVIDFQKRAGINPSGIIGPKTWAAMYQVVSISGGWGC